MVRPFKVWLVLWGLEYETPRQDRVYMLNLDWMSRRYRLPNFPAHRS
jgi:hypothetical protein